MTDYSVILVNEINAVKAPIDNLINITEQTLKNPNLSESYRALLTERLKHLNITSDNLAQQIANVKNKPNKIGINKDIVSSSAAFQANQIQNRIDQYNQSISNQEQLITSLQKHPANVFTQSRINRINQKIRELRQKQGNIKSMQQKVVTEKLQGKLKKIIKSYNNASQLHNREVQIAAQVKQQNNKIISQQEEIASNKNLMDTLQEKGGVRNLLLAERYRFRNYRLMSELPKLKLKQGFYKGCQIATVKVHQLYTISQNKLSSKSR